MSMRGTGSGGWMGPSGRSNRRPARRTGSKPGRPGAATRGQRRPAPKAGSKIVDKDGRESADIVEVKASPSVGPFRVLIAVHRPRYRGRAVRASALVGWEVTTLLNKQDVVGQVSRLPGPPDIVLLSGDFGRQKDYAIFRAIQAWRAKGMQLIGMVEDCQAAPEEFPDAAPVRLCDVCLMPPYTAAGIRAVLARLYEEKRGESAPPPRTAGAAETEEEDEE